MNTQEIDDTDGNVQKVKLNTKAPALDENEIMDEESKYEIFRKIRIKLGKTKEEFQNIFELYNHMRNP